MNKESETKGRGEGFDRDALCLSQRERDEGQREERIVNLRLGFSVLVEFVFIYWGFFFKISIGFCFGEKNSVFNFILYFLNIVLTWKIVRVSEVSVLYRYIDYCNKILRHFPNERP